jgi:RNase P subunit RPR2
MPKITDMAHHALETVTMPDPATVAQEIKSQYVQQIEELQEKAAVNIPKTGNKEEIKKLKQVKKTAKEELTKLEKLQDDKIKSVLKKAENDRNVLEKLHMVSQKYEERVLVKVGRSILKELAEIIRYTSDEPDEIPVQHKAKREVDSFIRSKMKEYHE